MFRWVTLLVFASVTVSCGPALHPGGILVPQLPNEREVVVVGSGTVNDRFIGFQGQLAYGIKPNASLVATLSAGDDWDNSRLLSSEGNRQYHLDLGWSCLLGKSAPEASGTYQFQTGVSLVRSFLTDQLAFPLHYQQNHLYAQASSRHRLFEHLYVVTALRLSGAGIYWIEKPTRFISVEPGQERAYAKYITTYNEITYRPIHLIASPVFQAEFDFDGVQVVLNVQPNYVLNQQRIAAPSTTINAGFIWKIRR